MIQKLLEHVDGYQVSIIVTAITPFAVMLSKNPNGYHVVQLCIQSSPASDIEVISVFFFFC